MDKYNQKWVLLFRSNKSNTTNAMTIGQTSYYSTTKEIVDGDLKWQKHENAHKAQWKRDGYIKFALTYLWYAHKYGYWDNPYEVEARKVADTNGN